MSQKPLVIAIDGPAASGKSTTAKLVAKRLGYIHVDTGAMYRAMALQFLRNGVELMQKRRIEELLKATQVGLQPDNGGLKVLLNGEDVTDKIRSADVTKSVSAVSTLRLVREAMVREQRAMGAKGGIVLDGRDIGTVVFPDADLKIFMVASIDARTQRRADELRTKGESVDVTSLKDDLEARDKLDTSRDESPLRCAEDALILDTSHLTIEGQVEFIVKKAEEILHKRKSA